MKIILLFLLCFPLSGYSQNVITDISISKVEESITCSDVPEYELYKIEISPGYSDHTYKFILMIPGKTHTKVLSQPEINVDLTVYKKNYKMPDGEEEWDYETEVKSNDVWFDEYIEIGNCSNSKYITCLLQLKKKERYKILVYNNDKYLAEFKIEDGEIKEK
ncbi:MAG: hypothetical protein WC358_08125 [Ignavibacteria bacterium]|jgi:hypothetical protein